MERIKSWVVGLARQGRRQRHCPAETTPCTNDPSQAKAQQELTEIAPQSKPDGGYGWVIVFASFLAHVVIYGVSWSVGIFNVIFLAEFQQSKTATAWVGSLLNAMMFSSGGCDLVTLVQRYGCRPVLLSGGVMASAGIALSVAGSQQLYVLYLTFSLLGGIGLGLAYIPTVVIVSEYFEQRRTIALGLAVSGVGLGGFVFPPVIRALMEVYTWRMVLLIIASIVLGTLTVCGALMKPIEKRNASAFQKGYLIELKENLGIMKSVPFLTSLQRRTNSGLIFSIVGVSNLVGRVLHGVVCHFPRMTTILVYMVSSVGSGIATLLMPASNSVIALCVVASVFGFCSSCLGALLPDIIIRLVGDQRLGIGYGFLLLFEGAGSMLGGPVAGMLFDYMLVYDYSFYLSGVLLMAAGLASDVERLGPGPRLRLPLLPLSQACVVEVARFSAAPRLDDATQVSWTREELA
ncbi:LOW QUALITY PROTEIN: monocarboxylate transporter 14-like [Pollicipes pollicipes]|uniref:LOW QUALITY PROTEIN: monocarboxylate transporter 14-like n=1 Tax=Pollicipes pollicipes TaxID=41117 RepID=UPI0018852C77|nr:LOW QUALITY PROTEIN: monocarboxylate transporter 14-like [Pollicipes pollicipes]